MKRKNIIKILVALGVVCAIGIGGYIYLNQRYQTYSQAQVVVPTSNTSKIDKTTTNGKTNDSKGKGIVSTIKGITNMLKDETTQQTLKSSTTLKEDYDYAHSVNPQVVAWIVIPGTDISYPVLHGNPDDFYLTHNWKGEPFWNGCVALDYMNSSLQNNTKLINGHNMLNGIMFSQLTKFGSYSFAEQHHIIELYDGQIDKLEYYQVFSAIYTQPNVQLNLGNNTLAERESTVNNLEKEKCYWLSKYDGGNILFLNTCLSNGTNTHIVVMSEEVNEA